MSSEATSTSSLPPAASKAAEAAVRAAIEKSQTPVASREKNDDEEAAAGDDKEPQTVEAGLVDPTQDITVFSNPEHFTVKHPLYSPWTMWFDSASKQVSRAACTGASKQRS